MRKAKQKKKSKAKQKKMYEEEDDDNKCVWFTPLSHFLPEVSFFSFFLFDCFIAWSNFTSPLFCCFIFFFLIFLLLFLWCFSTFFFSSPPSLTSMCICVCVPSTQSLQSIHLFFSFFPPSSSINKYIYIYIYYYYYY
ncbi:hypothetical protein, unlikely [Trypanosoma brucei brucei TREU927]|uniref:Uncharacterized protein n=1 Tax=Trypanosoma brucei brucei (strain 927/4 GUTat10.1) TaxID=185431 RepID=Q4GYM7_TRYB2|nr:hypothetical protein, unlikely [Trypanosoma brucei brucei TREU927]CAJ16557.1 hypothetical protein, unlikely [Trypanosoma brucei brucei TREU927]